MNRTLQASPFFWHLGSYNLTGTQDINVQNMNIELVAQMFKNYQSNVLFHLEGKFEPSVRQDIHRCI